MWVLELEFNFIKDDKLPPSQMRARITMEISSRALILRYWTDWLARSLWHFLYFVLCPPSSQNIIYQCIIYDVWNLINYYHIILKIILVKMLFLILKDFYVFFYQKNTLLRVIGVILSTNVSSSSNLYIVTAWGNEYILCFFHNGFDL